MPEWVQAIILVAVVYIAFSLRRCLHLLESIRLHLKEIDSRGALQESQEQINTKMRENSSPKP
jgi:hypothetical protein